MRRTPAITVRGLTMVLFLGLAAPGAWAAKSELNQLIPEVRLKDGTVLRDVTFVSLGGASITGKWAGGRGSIPLAQLPDALRADLVPVVAAKPAAPVPAAGSGKVSPGDAFNLPTEIKLTNGFTMSQAKVTGWQSDAMMVSYAGGKVLVKLENVVPEQRIMFEAQRVLAFAKQARMDAARAAQKSGQPLTPIPMSEEEQAALILMGIASHDLVIGMTKKQVFDAIGAPARTMKDASAPDTLYWFYPGKGRNEQGAACNRIVGFNKGILEGWKDE